MKVVAALAAFSVLAPVSPNPPKIKALILSGTNNHNWRQSTPFLRQLMESTGRFEVRVSEWPHGATARTFELFDVIVLDYCGPRWGPDTEAGLESQVKSGKGLVVFHAASYPFGEAPVLGDSLLKTGKIEPPWPEYRKMVGAYWVKAGENPTGHGDRHSFRVKFTDRSHPISQGLEESFWAMDELYHNFRMLPGIKVLATAYDDPKYRGTGKEEPVLWTLEYGKGRVFHTALGHNLAALQEPGFGVTFVRGAEWAATGRVTLPAKLAQGPVRPRILVVTGGHAYETSFYSLFDGLNWDHISSNEDAYKQDLRKKYDVIVMYDMSRTISDRAKKNLQDFLESGKGLVILHHAIASYQDWEWWWREVAGGRYVLKAEPGFPASNYKHDEEIFVRAALKHPVIGDTMPMHVIDEVYGNLWISDKIQVLATTDHPGTNGPLVWVSSYPKSRVVVNLLGHDHQSHRHAGFQQLVRNAILWTAQAGQ